MLRFILTTLLLIILSVGPSCTGGGYTPQSGDVLFQDLNSSQGAAVKLATGSEYTHCGIVLEVDGQMFVYEAVGPVQRLPFKQWTAAGVNEHYIARRLPSINDQLDPDDIEKMLAEATRHLGKNYDITFEWSDDKLYCSEFVWKIYERGAGINLVDPRALKTFDLAHPIVKAIMQKRYGDNIPLEEPVVAPSDLVDTDKLETVYSEN